MSDTATKTVPEFIITRDFNASRARVWDAWTTIEGLAAWFGPKEVTSEVLSHDLRPGGRFHFRMTGADGGQMYGLFVYRDIVPPTLVSWEHGFADAEGNRTRAPFDASFPLRLLTTVTFEEEGAKTRVTVSWVPLDATDAECATFAAMMDSMNGGWSGSFEQLDAYLAGAGG
jgi:uncharacterized protein YndB with AHSA1/START domain